MSSVFQEGLAKAAGCSDAWVITGGTKSGVMELVGEALGAKSTHNTDTRPPLIGIAPWRWLNETHRKELRARGGDVKTLRRPSEDEEEKFLDPNHTHFIMVDNGDSRGGRTVHGEIQLRNELERFCCLHLSVPLVCIVLQGGVGTFQTVVGALQNHCQALFLADSGGCAGIVAEFIEPLLKLRLVDVAIENGARR